MGETVETLPKGDSVMLLDASLLSRTALPGEAFLEHDVFCIDHHETSEASIPGYADQSASATCLILIEIAQALKWHISPRAATALLMGIYTDTGGFIHRSTDLRSFRAAGELMELGADQPRIATEVFGNYSLDYLHALGQ